MMEQFKEFLSNLFHIHQWEIIDEKIQQLYTDGYDYPTSVYKVYFLLCRKCGKIKMKKFKVF